ncbi:putative anti-sigma-YlaC factor YlaD [Actinophytocola oryzae]|uniref:Putative anti-sigma-YlaC factor YlaD n=1 Tax=Actinophytocola oryzae TaxID=502181 RepID=A0A4R7VHE7_9PSEU|nr:putative anti-sigma-YlaC factor YlaD [Actinophytocola oryzae]
MPEAQVDEHVRTCAGCQGWLDEATALTRSLRIRSATPVPDLTGAIIADAPVFVDTRGWWPRYALGVVAVAQLSLAFAQLFGVGQRQTHADHDAVPIASHLFNEGTAWNLALGVGLFWAAFRPRTAAGLIPVLTGFLALLLAYSTHDLIAGTAPVARVLGHGLLVAGLVLLFLVNRKPGGASPGHAVDTGTGGAAGTSTAPGDPAPAAGDPARPPLRPAGRHRAA